MKVREIQDKLQRELPDWNDDSEVKVRILSGPDHGAVKEVTGVTVNEDGEVILRVF